MSHLGFKLCLFLVQVQRILLELDIQNVQDSLATHLSEGQKRKLTIGIAILGDPQVSEVMHVKEGRWRVRKKSSSSFYSCVVKTLHTQMMKLHFNLLLLLLKYN